MSAPHVQTRLPAERVQMMKERFNRTIKRPRASAAQDGPTSLSAPEKAPFWKTASSRLQQRSGGMTCCLSASALRRALRAVRPLSPTSTHTSISRTARAGAPTQPASATTMPIASSRRTAVPRLDMDNEHTKDGAEEFWQCRSSRRRPTKFCRSSSQGRLPSPSSHGTGLVGLTSDSSGR
jgi:hypothetical protein